MVEQKEESGKKRGFLSGLKSCCLGVVALVGAAVFLGAYVMFGLDLNSDDKPKDDTAASASANPSEDKLKDTDKPKDETPTVSPSSLPSEGDYLPLEGIESGKCIGVEGGVSCAVEVNIDQNLGLAKANGGGYLVVECDSTKCVSRKGTPSDLPCVEQEIGVFCAQGVGDRGTFYTGLLSFAQGCSDDVKDDKVIVCTESGGVIPTEAGLQRNGVPIVVTRLPKSSNHTIGVYAAAPWSEARVANCYPTGGKIRCTL